MICRLTRRFRPAAYSVANSNSGQFGVHHAALALLLVEHTRRECIAGAAKKRKVLMVGNTVYQRFDYMHGLLTVESASKIQCSQASITCMADSFTRSGY